MAIYLVGTKSYWIILLVILARYLVLASLAFLVYYVLKRKAWWYKKIQQRMPAASDYAREIGFSIVTSFVFAGVGYLTFLTPLVKYTQVYYEMEERGMAYLAASVLAILFIHDTYFYWIHRIMHLPVVYRWVHRTHHQSVNPTPWAAMAFHPVEAILEAGIIPLVAVVMPVHPLAIGIFLLLMMVYNVYGHLGYEWYPGGFTSTWLGRWVNTSVSHNQHHQHVTGNYGLYFLFWDRWMGTLRKDYDQHFNRITKKVPHNSQI